jgi:hypothetical protein
LSNGLPDTSESLMGVAFLGSCKRLLELLPLRVWLATGKALDSVGWSVEPPRFRNSAPAARLVAQINAYERVGLPRALPRVRSEGGGQGVRQRFG